MAVAAFDPQAALDLAEAMAARAEAAAREARLYVQQLAGRAPPAGRTTRNLIAVVAQELRGN